MRRTGPAILLLLVCLCTWATTPSFQVSTIAGSNTAGDGGPAAAAILRQVEGLAVAANGLIYLSETASHRIRVIQPDGRITTLAGDGSPGYSGDGGPAEKARLHTPYGLSLDREGNLYIADLGNRRIRRISADGRIVTVAGGGDLAAGTESEGSAATALRLQSPRDVLAEAGGGFYFSDFDAHRVYFVNALGVLSIAAGTGTPGYGADNVAAIRSQLRNPAGLAFEPQGGLLIVESGNQRIRRVLRGTVTAYLTEAFRNFPLYTPTGIAFDTAGSLYITDARETGALKRSAQGQMVQLPLAGRSVTAHPAGGVVYGNLTQVLRVDAAGRSATIAGGTEVAGALLGDGGPADAAPLGEPAGLAVDNEGNIYVSEERGHRVRKIGSGGRIATLAGMGKAAYSGDGGAGQAAGLQSPRGLALDRFGNLYIADSGNHAVRRVAVNGVVTTIAGNGFAGFRGDGGLGTAAQLSSPSSVAFDAAGDLYVADTGNHRIRKIHMASGLITTFAGTAAGGFSGDGRAAVFAQLNAPMGVAADRAGNIYIADTGNNRVRRVDAGGTMMTLLAEGLLLPRGLGADAGGALYVADTGNHRVLRLDAGEVSVVAGTGMSGFGGDGAGAREAAFQFPAAVAVETSGAVLIADSANNRVRRLTAEVVAPPSFSAVRTVNAASGQASPLAPGMLATLYGTNFGPAEGVAGEFSGGMLPLTLAGTEVHMNGVRAPLLYVSATQINLQTPYELRGQREARIDVVREGVVRVSFVASVVESAPALFPVAVHLDGTLNSETNPAARGGIVTVYGTGEGWPRGGAETGKAVTGPLLGPAAILEVTIGGTAAEVLWMGQAPGLVGVLQVNLRTPAGFFASGGQPMVLRTPGAQAAPGFTLYMR